ncbi:hypothetical protein BRCON_2620 [Candidatus Sumerlaea chitinivorans]|uniref:Uncharacterized protein n=1 Tax=Sumerlaea chitinivorans TaxID=2250252 RepID=A0A2Z4Y9M8_SUMC1|nr:hypothetical protein BRCON_2620 [Candidatus Sumerlaea chitinivorans]
MFSACEPYFAVACARTIVLEMAFVQSTAWRQERELTFQGGIAHLLLRRM